MRVSKLSEYGILLVIYADNMQSKGAHLISAREFSNSFGIDIKSIRQVLFRLIKADIFESIRGRSGGYRLVAPISSLSLYDIVSAVDGQPLKTLCDTNKVLGDFCTDSTNCSIRKVWLELGEIIDNYLKKVKIADLVRDQQVLPINTVAR